MNTWLRILGGMYIVIGGLNALLLLFILVVYGGKSGMEGIRAEEYVPVIGHLGGWVLYVLLAFSIGSIFAGLGFLTLSHRAGRFALLLSTGNVFIYPFGTIIALLTISTLFLKRGRNFLVPAKLGDWS